MSAASKRADLGRVAKLRCPHCHEVTFYHLRKDKYGDLHLQCAACQYDVPVAASERQVAEALVALGAAFARGELSAAAHAEALSKAPLESLKRLLAEGSVNNCAACGEEVPPHFERCWNCGGEVAATMEVDETLADSVGFPDVIFGATPLIDHERDH